MIRQLVINNIALAVQYMASGLGALIINPFVVKSIGQEQFGYVAIALSVGVVLGILINYGTFLTGARDIATAKNIDRQLHVFVELTKIKLFILAAVLVMTSGVFIALYYSRYQLYASQMLIIAGLSVAAAFNSTWVFQGLNKFITVSILSILITSTTIASCYLIFTENGSSLDAAIVYIMGPLVMGLGTMIMAISHFRVPWKLLFKIYQIPKDRLSEGFPLVLSQLISALYAGGGPAIIAIIISAQSAGAFASIERIVTPVLGALTLIHMASFPVLSKAFSNDKKKYVRLIISITVIYEVCALTLVAICSLYDKEIISYIAGPPTDELIKIYYSSMVWIVTGIFGHLVTGYWSLTKKEGQILRLNVSIFVLTAMLSPAFVTEFGAHGWFLGITLAQVPLLYFAGKIWLTELHHNNSK
jgi:O-antigen/teichoic acid export membrane protein